MDQETPQKPEIKPEINQNIKKRGWLANLLSFLGFGSSAGAGAGGITAVSGAGSGLFGGLLGGGVMATKAGMVALALAGSTVAGGIGFVGYKMFVNPNASGKAGASGNDQFNSLFASRPKDASPAQSSGSSASSKDGNSSSLEFLAKANQGPMAESENKPEEAATADTESKTSDAAADQANPTAALNNANAPAAGQAASLHTSGLKSDKKFGALSSGLAGGNSGANFSTAMKSVPSASNPLLAKGGKVDPTSAMRGQGRSLLAGRRDQFKRESKSSRQLGNLNRMQKGGVGNAGSLTFDGGPGGTTIGSAEGGEIGGSPSGQSGVPDRSINPTPFSQKDVNEPQTPASRDVTPWKDEIKKGKMLMLASMAGFFLAIVLLQHYYKQWVEEYNAGWFAAYAMSYLTTANGCLAACKAAVATSICQPCTTAFAGMVAKQIAITEATGNTLTGLAAKAQAKAVATQAEGATRNVATGVVTGAVAAGTETSAVEAANQAMRRAAETKAVASVTASSLALETGAQTHASCVSGLASTTCLPPIAAGTAAYCAACTADVAKVEAATQTAVGCLAKAQTVTEGAALEAGFAMAESKAAVWKWLSRAAIVGALASAGMVINIGTKMQKGEYKQENAGKVFVIGGAFMAAVSGWFLISELTTADVPSGTSEIAAAKSGALKADSMTKLAPFASMPTLMSTIGIAALLGIAGKSLMTKGESYKCKSDAECKKIESTSSLKSSSDRFAKVV